jgi:hypothetical protein
MRDSRLTNYVAYDKLPLHGRYSTEVACRWQRMPNVGSNVSVYSRQRSQEGYFAPHWYLLPMREIVRQSEPYRLE